MPIVAAFLLPGLPHPLLKPEVKPWGLIAAAATAAGKALAAARPEALLIYSTQWIAVLDQLWQARPEIEGVHVDENWYELGDISFHIRTDTALAQACIAKTADIGIRSKPVDYDAFPVDTGTLVAQHFLNKDASLPIVSTSNNVYHDWQKTEALGGVARSVAEAGGKRVAAIGVGGLSSRMFRSPIDPSSDHFAQSSDDDANRLLLSRLESGDAEGVRHQSSEMAGAMPTDFGLKHLAFLLGAVGGSFRGASVHGYGPIYGTGAAAVELHL
jgi:2-aminophenol/2-amino-5-chlorophenol 1,6-dioxygenase alpha subunit